MDDHLTVQDVAQITSCHMKYGISLFLGRFIGEVVVGRKNATPLSEDNKKIVMQSLF